MCHCYAHLMNLFVEVTKHRNKKHGPRQVKECKMSPEQSLLSGCVCGYVAELSTLFSVISSPLRCTRSRQVGFLCVAAQLCKFISVTSSVSNEQIASNIRLRCTEMGNLRKLMKFKGG